MKANRPRPRMALATSRKVASLSEDDQRLLEALEVAGFDVRPLVWDESRPARREFDCVVIRSCWDYHLRPAPFLDWISELERGGVVVWNPPPTLRWNHDKRYLKELAEQGIPVVPTIWIDSADAGGWSQQLRAAGWGEGVVKPMVSASAHGTFRLNAPGDPDSIATLTRAAANCSLMVQPYLEELVRKGEWSLVFLGGRFSHAVLKRPAPGDFRVQKEFGGRLVPAEPTSQAIEDAQAILAAAPKPHLYARVDAVEIEGRLVLVELEMIEPELFFWADPAAPLRFVEALEALDGSRS